MTHRPVLNHALRDIQNDLMRMGSLVDRGLQQALQALRHRDLRLARAVASNDSEVNGVRFRLEAACLACLATQQPTASDLRAVVAAIVVANELERMGDYAAGIARTVVRLGETPPPQAPLNELEAMNEVCRDMVRQSLLAYVGHNETLARQVAARDDELDQIYRQVFQHIAGLICANTNTATPALYWLFVAHNLERIGDRVVNIAERVVFVNNGELAELNAGPEAPL